MSKPRKPSPRFLAPNGRTRSKPLREVPSLGVHEEDRLREVDVVASRTDHRDEPETVSDAILTSYAEVNRRIYTQQHALDVAQAQQLRPMLAAEDRLKDIRRRARHAHVDLSHETHIMQRELDRARTGGRKPPERTLTRLERIESLLDGVDTRLAA